MEQLIRGIVLQWLCERFTAIKGSYEIGGFTVLKTDHYNELVSIKNDKKEFIADDLRKRFKKFLDDNECEFIFTEYWDEPTEVELFYIPTEQFISIKDC